MKEAIRRADQPLLMSAGSVLEVQTVLFRRFEADAIAGLDDLIAFVPFVVVPVTFRQVKIARSGYARYGRAAGGGRNGLNFGDCFAYALAIERDTPLLFVGRDFGQTDVRALS